MAWNQHLFLLINASAHPNAVLLLVARLIAGSPVYAGPALLAGLWIWGPAARRGALLSVALAMLIGLGINQVLGALWFEPRPFMIGLGHKLIAHPADNSFPSDHATFVWSLGLGLIITTAARRWGLAVCVYGLFVAWARVFLGVHFPIDMMAPVPVAIVAAGCARAMVGPIDRLVLPALDAVYETVLRILHLPPGLFPRRS